MDEVTDTTIRSTPPHERRREGRVEYSNPALITLLRQPPAAETEATPDAALLERRFSLARRVRAYDTAPVVSKEAQHGRKIAVAELDACEAECRARGLIR